MISYCLKTSNLIKIIFSLLLQSPIPVSDIFPGQFINVEIKEATEIFLRRPFSVLDVDYEKQTISLLVKILGRGSRKLTEAREGQKISAIFPLGKSFTLPNRNDQILLIGGGSGVAPMLFLSKICGLNPANVTVLIGAKSSSDHIDITAYQIVWKFLLHDRRWVFGRKRIRN